MQNIQHDISKSIIYVCSKYRGDIKTNIKNAKKYCKYVIDKGKCPFAPHLFSPQILDDNIQQERNKGLELNTNFLKIAEELWVFGEISQGMQLEIDIAKQLNKKIVFIIDFI